MRHVELYIYIYCIYIYIYSIIVSPKERRTLLWPHQHTLTVAKTRATYNVKVRIIYYILNCPCNLIAFISHCNNYNWYKFQLQLHSLFIAEWIFSLKNCATNTHEPYSQDAQFYFIINSMHTIELSFSIHFHSSLCTHAKPNTYCTSVSCTVHLINHC